MNKNSRIFIPQANIVYI